MKASYEVVPILVTPSISSGEEVIIDVYFSGDGSIKNQKLSFYSQPNLFDPDTSGKLFWAVNMVVDYDDKQYNSRDGIPFTNEMRSFTIPKEYFQHHFPESGNNMGVNLAELSINGNPPMRLNIKTNPKIKSGNYPISFILTYSDGDATQTNYKSVNLHIKSWVEQHSKLLQIAGIGIAVFATVAGIFFTR